MKHESRYCESVDEAIELPRVVRLERNLFALPFTLMKMVPARFILQRAHAEGLLTKGSTVIETTSGTFGLALAILSAIRGYRLILVSDPAIDAPLRRRLEDLGARVEIVRQPAEVGGFQAARLQRMAELQAEFPDHFWPSQYHNPSNAGAYACVAALLAGTVGRLDYLVGTCGSGGSLSGSAHYLRNVFPRLQAVAVDTHGSVLFGHPDRKRQLRGLGNSLMPTNLDHTQMDEVHWVTAAEAYRATRELHSRHALYMGGTSGASYMVARWYARRHPDAMVAALLPDEGYRYQDTIYDDAWIAANGLLCPHLPEDPFPVARPADAPPCWSRYVWRRRTYVQVMGTPFENRIDYAQAIAAVGGK